VSCCTFFCLTFQFLHISHSAVEVGRDSSQPHWLLSRRNHVQRVCLCVCVCMRACVCACIYVSLIALSRQGWRRPRYRHSVCVRRSSHLLRGHHQSHSGQRCICHEGTRDELVSDIAIFVLKRDVKLQLTN